MRDLEGDVDVERSKTTRQIKTDQGSVLFSNNRVTALIVPIVHSLLIVAIVLDLHMHGPWMFRAKVVCTCPSSRQGPTVAA